MVTDLSPGPKENMARHAMALRGYAIRVFENGETLPPDEDRDRAFRIREYLAIGLSFGCSETELVTLLYNGLFKTKLGCDCYTCQAR